jgi:vacuolar-type H+-ATPase subunit I/STV1
MIAKMKKVFVVGPSEAREALLDALRDIGVVHLEPVAPSAGAPEELVDEIQRHKRAEQILRTVRAKGDKPELSPAEAVTETLRVFRRTEENHHRLGMLAREAIRLRPWRAWSSATASPSCPRTSTPSSCPSATCRPSGPRPRKSTTPWPPTRNG